MKSGTPTSKRSAEFVLTILVSIAALPVLGYALWRLIDSPLDSDYLLFGIVTVLVASRLNVGAANGPKTLTVSDCFILVSLLLYGIWPAVLLAAIEAAFAVLHYKDRRKLIPFEAGRKVLFVFVSGLVAQVLFGTLGHTGLSMPLMFGAAGLTTLIYCVLSAVMSNIAEPAEHQPPALVSGSESVLWWSISWLATAAAVGLIVTLISVVSLYPFIVGVPIIAFTYLMYRPSTDQVEQIEERHYEAHDGLAAMEALAAAIDCKEPYSRQHVRRVQIYSAGVATFLGLSEPEIEALHAAAVLHDIGKFAVPDYILNKPGPLTPSELERMRLHTVIGADIIEKAALPYPVVPIVRHHHERWDGRGYPDGLKGDEIPVTARILTAVDCYDTLREPGQHGEDRTRQEALSILKAESGRVFDPEVVRIFLEHLTEFEADIRWQQVDFQASTSRRLVLDRRRPRPDPEPRSGRDRGRAAHHELTALYDIARTVAMLDFKDAFAVLSSRLEEAIGCTTSAVYLLRPGSDSIEAAFVGGQNWRKLKGKKMAPGAGITGWVIANGHSMHNCDPAVDFDALDVEMQDRYLTATAIPLLMQGETAAALAVYSAEIPAFEPEHLRLIEAVAKLTSDSLSNAVRRESNEATALNDPITTLPNARALRCRFEEELDRARRHNDTFALLMMDLDGFGAVNEHYGHQAGDMIMRQMAAFLVSLIRSGDFIGRYGSDEFVAVVQASPDEIVEMARRIQRAVDRKDFGPAGASLFIGVSIGGACFGANGSTFDEVLLEADRAMRADKQRRKTLMSDSAGAAEQTSDRYRVM
jgi:diguanylate cyclase (GGDEF)-like protein/putative nucleotidyltransferase with HDIG domain